MEGAGALKECAWRGGCVKEAAWRWGSLTCFGVVL